MPTYVAKCNECGAEKDFLAKVDDRDRMNGEKCPNCESGILNRIITAVNFGDPVKMGFQKPDQGMKEVLQRIHEKTPGSNLKEQSTIVKL